MTTVGEMDDVCVNGRQHSSRRGHQLERREAAFELSGSSFNRAGEIASLD
jgi:hypothetical protein